MDYVKFREIFDQYYLGIYKFAYEMVDDTAEAEDITSHTFITLWENRETEIKSIRPYLYIVAANKAKDFIRRRKHIRFNPIEGDDYPEETDPETPELPQVHKIIDNLHPNHKRIVVMKFFGGYKVSEISKLLHIPLSTVKNTCTLFIHTLRSKIKNPAS